MLVNPSQAQTSGTEVPCRDKFIILFHGIIESFRLEKTFMIIESKC